MKKSLNISLSALCAIALSSTTFGQVKVATNGSVAIGTVNNPWTNARLQVVSGTGGYTAFSETTSIPTSSAMIRGLNAYSTSSNPDFTWWGNDQTGIFHPSSNVLAFTVGGSEKGRFTGGTYALTVYGNALSSGAWVTSDLRYKKNIAEIKDPLNRILQLQGRTYEFKTDEFQSLSFNPGSNLGFIAQDLAKIFPEAVKADEKGYLAVNYDMLIPVLVEAIKSQQKTIESQNERISNLENNSSSLNTNSIGIEKSAKLYQNTPNPFSESTTIKCDVPSESKVSELYIYDMQGSQIKTIKITDKGSVNIVLRSGELKPGMYFYSLIIDKKEIDTKKMILTAE